MNLHSFNAIVILLLKTSFVIGTPTNYSKDFLQNKYPGYGTKWIYFPDGDDILRVGYLEMPSDDFATNTSDSNEIEKLVTFHLYTRVLKNGVILSLTNNDVIRSEFSFNKNTKFITHGWRSNGKSDTCLYIRDAYLFKEDVNVIIVDWGEIASNIFYPIPMAKTKEIGHYYGKFINYLLEMGADSNRIHLIGHSLGAHISGFAGRSISNQKLKRITGLDPAKPGFTHGFNADRLSSGDANFVDIIHSCGGVLGILEPIGDVDFYPNGGTPPQPGCTGLAEVIDSCSHGRSWKYFAESIISEHKFMGQKCKSWNDYERKSCENDLLPMGNPVPATARGSYYLKTESSPPYARIANLNSIENNKINK